MRHSKNITIDYYNRYNIVYVYWYIKMSDNSRFDPTPYTAGASPGIRQGGGGGGAKSESLFFFINF